MSEPMSWWRELYDGSQILRFDPTPFLADGRLAVGTFPEE